MLNTKKHEDEIKKILYAIFSSEIKDYLGFKGGTLTYFCYGLDRFSTDIDIDILDISQENKIIETTRNILLELGDIKNETLGKTLHRWTYRYDESNMNIKVELNKRIWENNTYETKEINGINITCMEKDSLFGNKIVALSERFKNRDLYDVNFFLKKGFPLNKGIIKERTGKELDVFIKDLIKILPEKYTQSSILAELGEILDDKQKIWMKNKCLDETIFLLDKYLH